MERETAEKEGLLCHSSLKSFTNTARGQRRPTSLFPNRQSTVPLPFFANSSTCHNVSGHRPLDWSETETERRFAFQPEPPPPTAEHTRGTSSENLRAREGSESPLQEACPGLALLSSDSCALRTTPQAASARDSAVGFHSSRGLITILAVRSWTGSGSPIKKWVSGRQGHLSGRKHSQSPGWPGTSQEVLPSLPFTPERVLAWTRHVATLQSGGWEGPAVPGQVSF